MRNLSLFTFLMAAIAMLNLSSCADGVASSSCDVTPEDSAEVVASASEPAEEVSDEVDETPQTSSNWEYRTTEDKLNETQNYWAEIHSVDGKISCTVAEINSGTGHYNTVFGVVWNDLYKKEFGRVKIGLKVAGDESWRHITLKGDGDSGTGDPNVDLIVNDKVAKLLMENKNFTILLGNDEYQFRPNAPLRKQHKEEKRKAQEEEAEKDPFWDVAK